MMNNNKMTISIPSAGACIKPHVKCSVFSCGALETLNYKTVTDMKNKPTGKGIVEQILPYIDEKVKSIDLNRLYTCIDSALDIWAAERMQNLIDELIVIRSATHTQNDYRAITIAIEKSKEYLLEKEEVPEWINAITEPPQLVKGAFKVKIKDGTELYAGWDRRYQPNWIDYYSEEPLDVAFYMPNVETKC